MSRPTWWVVSNDSKSVQRRLAAQLTVRQRALRLYRAPFRYEMGYIWDANGEMVADDRVDSDDKENHASSIAARVRGWGRIGYMPDADKLQDEVGALIAEALTKFWGEAK